ncbi:hypothetical protein JKA74_06025 [Marivirga sp. S37H4]|uniref:Uncharacterized protein n=1 Tax=Marivirga aurantiaca TaxID=2802615 RepID=A0A934WXF2_9BACT|nr:hypothetical protein [Marivirga aurantiaca]MBK6264590.1 hypothetical protein [Marivirga aurantiaca]
MQEKIFSTGNGGHYHIFEIGEFEYSDPLEIYHESEVNSIKSKFIFLLTADFPSAPKGLIETKAKKAAQEHWKKRLSEVENCKLPKELEFLLSENKKARQINLLKNLTLTTDQLFKFYKITSERGFKMSQYIGESLPLKIEESELPKMTYIDGDKIVKFGQTSLSDGQLRHMIKFRNKTIGKFLDKGDHWHCFYITFRSIAGKEPWQNGQAHLHYLSNAFGLSRAEVVDRIRKNNAPSSPVHINITDYGNQSNQ